MVDWRGVDCRKVDWQSARLIYGIVLVAWIGTDAAMGRHAEFFNSYELVLRLVGGGHPGRPFIFGQAALGIWAWVLGLLALVLLPALVAAAGLGALRLHEWKGPPQPREPQPREPGPREPGRRKKDEDSAS